MLRIYYSLLTLVHLVGILMTWGIYKVSLCMTYSKTILLKTYNCQGLVLRCFNWQSTHLFYKPRVTKHAIRCFKFISVTSLGFMKTRDIIETMWSLQHSSTLVISCMIILSSYLLKILYVFQTGTLALGLKFNA